VSNYSQDDLNEWFSTWELDPHGCCLPFFEGSQELLIKILILTFRFYISYMKALFVVAKIIGLPGKNDDYFLFQNCSECDYDCYKVVSVIMIVTVLLCLATHE